MENVQIVSYLVKHNLPAVDLRGLHKMPDVPLVETNDVLVTRLALEHLLERGFQRFGFCGFEGANYSRRRKTFLSQMLAESRHEAGNRRQPQSAHGRYVAH